jgi:hypothetical protein
MLPRGAHGSAGKSAKINTREYENQEPPYDNIGNRPLLL